MTVNQLVDLLCDFEGHLEVMVSTERGLIELTPKMVVNDFHLDWENGAPIQGNEVITIAPLHVSAYTIDK